MGGWVRGEKDRVGEEKKDWVGEEKKDRVG